MGWLSVCVHKGGLVRISVPSEWKCKAVCEAAGEARQDVSGPSGCAEALQHSGNICFSREQLSKHICWLKVLQAWFCPTQNHWFLNSFSLTNCHG